MGVILAGSVESFPVGKGGALSGPPGGAPKFQGGTTVHPVPVKDPTEEEMAKWMQAHIQYENLADNDDLVDRARTYVTFQKRWFESRTNEVRDLWQTLDMMLRGNTLSRRFPESDIHVPELYKMIEGLVPALEDAMLQYDPWFTVMGRDRMDRFRAKKLQYWIDYLLDLAKFTDLVQPGLRAMLIYGFAAFKVWWEVEYTEVVRRDVEKTAGPRPAYRIKPNHEKRLTYEGMRLQLIDAYDWMVDLSNPDHQQGLWCGDTRKMTLDDIQAGADLGYFKNVEELYEQEPIRAAYGTSRWAKIARRLDSADDVFEHKRAPGQPKEFEVSEIWCKWQPTDDEQALEYVITVANDKTVLRIQENFHDDKHRPYAVARIAKDPFDFRSPGILDHAVRLSIELDEHENLAYRGHALSQCPITWIGPDSDAPDNLMDVDVGEVFRTRTPPTWHTPPNRLGDYLAFKEGIRRDIEEVTGGYRIHEQPTTTATEIERKVQEKNSRMRGPLRAFTSCCEQILSQAHALSAQFVMQRKVFRVIGRNARAVRQYQEIGPDDLQDPVDFEFQGMFGLQNLGLRGTQLSTFMNVAASIIPDLQGRVNSEALFSQLYEAIVGEKLSDDILKIPQSLDELIPPDEENYMLATGSDFDIHEMDEDLEHMHSHMAFIEQYRDSLSDEGLQNLVIHNARHETAYKRKALKQQALGGDQPMRESLGEGGLAGKQPLGGNGLNDRQPDLFAPGYAASTPPGEAPGPPSARTNGSPDRQNPIPQTENRR